jgi:hypothetical protein
MNDPTRGEDIGDEGGAGTGPTVLSYHGAGLLLKTTESHTKRAACVHTNNLHTTTMGDNTTQELGSVEGAGAELGSSGKHGSTSPSESLGGLGQNTMSVFAGSSTMLTRDLSKSSAADSTDVLASKKTIDPLERETPGTASYPHFKPVLLKNQPFDAVAEEERVPEPQGATGMMDSPNVHESERSYKGNDTDSASESVRPPVADVEILEMKGEGDLTDDDNGELLNGVEQQPVHEDSSSDGEDELIDDAEHRPLPENVEDNAHRPIANHSRFKVSIRCQVC